MGNKSQTTDKEIEDIDQRFTFDHQSNDDRFGDIKIIKNIETQ